MLRQRIAQFSNSSYVFFNIHFAFLSSCTILYLHNYGHAYPLAGLNSVNLYQTTWPLKLFCFSTTHLFIKQVPIYKPLCAGSVLMLGAQQQTQALADILGSTPNSVFLCDLGYVPHLSLHFLCYYQEANTIHPKVSVKVRCTDICAQCWSPGKVLLVSVGA